MPLPDPHATEPTVEISGDIYKRYEEALAKVTEWTEYANKLKAAILDELGDAYAGTVDGEKVVSHRPKQQYAATRIQKDYPDLVQRFMRWKTEEMFDLDAFVAAHPEIAEQYRVRAFVKLG